MTHVKAGVLPALIILEHELDLQNVLCLLPSAVCGVRVASAAAAGECRLPTAEQQRT